MIWFGWVWFHGRSIILGYLIPYHLYSYILNIYDCDIIVKIKLSVIWFGVIWFGLVFMAYQPGAILDLEAMALKYSPKLQHHLSLIIRFFTVISRILVGEVLRLSGLGNQSFLCTQFVLFDPLIVLYQMLPLWFRVDLWVMTMKYDPTLHKDPRLDPRHLMV